MRTLQSGFSQVTALQGSKNMKNHIDITGQKFFRLTAIRFEKRTKHDQLWTFLCDCGEEKVIKRRKVVAEGSIKSCGCSRIESITTHGMTDTRFYRIWANIKYRCTNPNAIRWEQYGGRGISIEWGSFDDFKSDMHDSYLEHCRTHGEKNTSINRIDNDGNYCKENCEWENPSGQARNRKTSRFIELNGEKHTLMEWSERTGIKRSTIDKRIRLGWSIAKALS